MPTSWSSLRIKRQLPDRRDQCPGWHALVQAGSAWDVPTFGQNAKVGLAGRKSDGLHFERAGADRLDRILCRQPRGLCRLVKLGCKCGAKGGRNAPQPAPFGQRGRKPILILQKHLYLGQGLILVNRGRVPLHKCRDQACGGLRDPGPACALDGRAKGQSSAVCGLCQRLGKCDQQPIHAHKSYMRGATGLQ